MIDDNIMLKFYLSVGAMFLLFVMLFFHRQHVFKYLYMTNIVCILITIFAYIAMLNHPVGYNDPRLWMQAMPFVLLFGIFASCFLFIISICCFVIENATRHLWAQIIIVVFGVVFVLFVIWALYMLFQGIKSLKSG